MDVNIIILITICICFIIICNIIFFKVEDNYMRFFGLCFGIICIIFLLMTGILFPKDYSGECIELHILKRTLLSKNAVLILSNGEVIVIDQMKFLITSVIYKCEILDFVGNHKRWVYDIEKKDNKKSEIDKNI